MFKLNVCSKFRMGSLLPQLATSENKPLVMKKLPEVQCAVTALSWLCELCIIKALGLYYVGACQLAGTHSMQDVSFHAQGPFSVLIAEQ